jgi:hypothetical protein
MFRQWFRHQIDVAQAFMDALGGLGSIRQPILGAVFIDDDRPLDDFPLLRDPIA